MNEVLRVILIAGVAGIAGIAGWYAATVAIWIAKALWQRRHPHE